MDEFIDYLHDQFAAIGPFSTRRMFGGYGLYWQGHFFGLVADGTVYLRTDARNRGDYEARELTPFKPWEDRKVVLKSYYPLPEDVLEDADEAAAWARRAIDAALEAARQAPAKPRPRRRSDPAAETARHPSRSSQRKKR